VWDREGTDQRTCSGPLIRIVEIDCPFNTLPAVPINDLVFVDLFVRRELALSNLAP
jgi:hypothetical protein